MNIANVRRMVSWKDAAAMRAYPVRDKTIGELSRKDMGRILYICLVSLNEARREIAEKTTLEE